MIFEQFEDSLHKKLQLHTTSSAEAAELYDELADASSWAVSKRFFIDAPITMNNEVSIPALVLPNLEIQPPLTFKKMFFKIGRLSCLKSE